MANYKISGSEGLLSFPLSSAFVDKYMPDANPTFVKVYLYGLRLCYAVGMEKNNTAIASALGILESDVVLAWKYWESVGAVKIKPGDGIEFLDLTAAQINSAPKKPVYKAREMAEAIEENEDLKLLLTHAQNIFGKTFSNADIAILYSFYDWLELPVEVILMLLEHCASLEKYNLRYAEKIAISWAGEGIDTIDKAKNHLKKSENREKINRKYKRLLGIVGRNLSDAEYAHIIQWTENMEFTPELIKLAYEKTVMATGTASFPYINGILQSWHKQGIKTAQELEKDEPSPVKKAAAARPKNKFVDYEQSGVYDFDEIERIALEKRIGK